jgi:hypothetical protein
MAVEYTPAMQDPVVVSQRAAKNRTSALGSAFPKLDRHAFRKALFESCGQPLPQFRFLLGRKS